MAFYNDIGTLDSTPVTRDSYSVDKYDTTDVFEFSINYMRDINLSLTNISADDDVDVTLYRDNGNGIFNASEDTYIAGSHMGSNLDDSINVADQVAGTYFAQVNLYADGSSNGVTYNLALSATLGYTPSNLLPIETQVGELSPSENRTFNDFVGNSDTSDVYAFSLGYFEGTNIRLDGLSTDADLRLMHDSNGNRIVDEGDVLLRSVNGGTMSDSISLDDAGDYFLQVYQFSGDTSYTLTFENFSTGAALAVAG
ncbi:MAG: pre-peptidase C-terminal domain-containing protein [Calothrix sp. FI2-JRJ7]|jgi:hypothetical protein|nr:pre-peptidase C-terminal domain-containing protein [Calothrix sp. FI2-JRJ7]